MSEDLLLEIKNLEKALEDKKAILKVEYDKKEKRVEEAKALEGRRLEKMQQLNSDLESLHKQIGPSLNEINTLQLKIEEIEKNIGPQGKTIDTIESEIKKITEAMEDDNSK